MKACPGESFLTQHGFGVVETGFRFKIFKKFLSWVNEAKVFGFQGWFMGSNFCWETMQGHCSHWERFAVGQVNPGILLPGIILCPKWSWGQHSPWASGAVLACSSLPAQGCGKGLLLLFTLLNSSRADWGFFWKSFGIYCGLPQSEHFLLYSGGFQGWGTSAAPSIVFKPFSRKYS